MSNAYDRIGDRILKYLEQVGRSPVDQFTLLRVAATLGDPPAVNRTLQLLIIRGELRRIGNLYIRVPAACQGAGRASAALRDSGPVREGA